MKNVSDWGLGNSGITFGVDGAPKLAYGSGYGFGCGWLPYQIQNAIVSIWNPIACFFAGHDKLAVEMAKDGFKVDCFSCCKTLRKEGKSMFDPENWEV